MILFYHPLDLYGCFSNFSLHKVRVFGSLWDTSEHAFQAVKMEGREDLVEKVRKAKTPGKAADIGRNNPMRRDWESEISPSQRRKWMDKEVKAPDGGRVVIEVVKDLMMAEIILAKFEQHKDLRNMLLSTGDKIIVENSPRDHYWGWGRNKDGKNKLGRILMLVRENLSNQVLL